MELSKAIGGAIIFAILTVVSGNSILGIVSYLGLLGFSLISIILIAKMVWATI